MILPRCLNNKQNYITLTHGEVALADRSTSSIGGADIVLLPEPSRWLLLAAGLGCLVALLRVSRRR